MNENISEGLEFDDIDLDDLGFDAEEQDKSEGISDQFIEEFSIENVEEFQELLAEDGTDFNFDFDTADESEFEGFEEATEVLRSSENISKSLQSYYSYSLNALQKLFANRGNNSVHGVKPPITDFDYITPARNRQFVYGFFCQVLDELTNDPKLLDLSEEEAYQYMKDELFNDIHWTANVNEEKFRRTFFANYESNKKLAQATVDTGGNVLGNILSKSNLTQAVTVFRINSNPFTVAAKFFEDPNLASSQRVDVKSLGGVAQDIKSKLGKRAVTGIDLYNGVIQFLTSDETLQILNLTREDVLDYDIGELLRRFVLHELNEGEFVPQGIQGYINSPYSDGMLQELAKCLLNGMRRQSFAAEIIFITLDLMMKLGFDDVTLRAKESQVKKFRSEYVEPFTEGIMQYLSAFCADPSYVNPVFYTLIGESDSDDSATFELTYSDSSHAGTVEVPGILCEVVGDNSTIYQIPLVMKDPETNCMVCPPTEVVTNIRRITATGRMQVTGTVIYRYVPSYHWLSSLNMTATSKPEKSDIYDASTAHIGNPVLDVLINYTNSFDTTGENAEVVSFTSNEVKSLLGLRKSDGIINISRLVLADDTLAEKGTLFIDSEDKTAVLRYVNARTKQEKVKIFSPEDYTIDILCDSEESSSDDISYSSILGANMSNVSYDDIYSRAVVKRVCMLTALDYETELENARVIIIRDLDHILRTTCLDEILGYKIFQLYVDAAVKDGSIDNFNLATLKEVADFTLGTPNVFTECTEFNGECFQKLNEVLAFKDKAINEITLRFSTLNYHLLALQSLSRSEIPRGGDRKIYEALHYIPQIHAILRTLEDQMVLLRTLHEVGDDIVPIIMKVHSVHDAYKSLCTKDTIDSIERKFLTSVKSKEKVCLPVTRRVLFNDMSDRFIILKYFILERNPYGVLTSFEECLDGTEYGDISQLYYDMKAEFGVDKDAMVCDISENTFRSNLSKKEIDRVFLKFYNRLLDVVYSGLITEVSKITSLQVIKAFDLLTLFGSRIFNFSDRDQENFEDTSEFEKAFYSYAGSFFVSYCPAFGEAQDEIDGGMDRFSAYLRHRSEFSCKDILSKLEKYEVTDLRRVEGADSSDVLEDAASESIMS